MIEPAEDADNARRSWLYLLAVYSAFSAGVVAGIWNRVTPQSLGLVIVLDLVMLAIVLVATTAASRFRRLIRSMDHHRFHQTNDTPPCKA